MLRSLSVWRVQRHAVCSTLLCQQRLQGRNSSMQGLPHARATSCKGYLMQPTFVAVIGLKRFISMTSHVTQQMIGVKDQSG